MLCTRKFVKNRGRGSLWRRLGRGNCASSFSVRGEGTGGVPRMMCRCGFPLSASRLMCLLLLPIKRVCVCSFIHSYVTAVQTRCVGAFVVSGWDRLHNVSWYDALCVRLNHYRVINYCVVLVIWQTTNEHLTNPSSPSVPDMDLMLCLLLSLFWWFCFLWEQSQMCQVPFSWHLI